MEYSADELNLLTARKQVFLPDSKESCKQELGLEAGRLPAAGLGSCSTVQPLHYSRDSGLGKLQFPAPFCACPCKLQFPEPFNEPERMSVEINADDFCIAPCTSKVVAGPWLVKKGTGEKPGSVSAVKLWFCPPLIATAIACSTEHPSSPWDSLGGHREDPGLQETQLLQGERQINYRSQHSPWLESGN